MNTLDSWFNAKKTPEERARDAEKAKALRRKKNNSNRKPPSKKSFRGKSTRPSKKKSYEDDSDVSIEVEIKSSSEEEEEFNVDMEDEDSDDEELVLHDDEDSDDGIENDFEEIRPDGSTRKSRAAARKNRAKTRTDANLDMEDEDSDDEELVLHDDEDSDDGIENDFEEIRPDGSTRKSRAAARKNRAKTRTDALSVDSDSDDDEGESFLPSRDQRPSKPSRLLQQNNEMAKNRHNPSLNASLTNVQKKKRKTSGESSLMLLKAPALKKGKTKTTSSIVAKRENPNDYDEEVTSPLYTPQKPKNVGKINPEDDYEEILSSDEENIINRSNANSKNSRVTSNGESSRYFGGVKQKKSQTITLDDSDSDSSDDDQPTKARSNNKKSHALEDTPEPNDADRRRRLKKMNGASNKKITYKIDDSSDEDEAVNFHNTNVDDAGFDEDIKVAMKLSLESKRKADEMKKKKANVRDDQIEMILDDSSDEEDADQGDDYYDQEKETASNVLKSAERLSGQVVRAMSGWFGKKEGGGAIQGIIVDGALALGNIDDSKSNSDKAYLGNGKDDKNTHKWISQAEMSKAIPNVKLSGYQLIGVNWMALLNGMTCEVGTKGTKNVNGVLADEMGLGKTVQTISFLAWLKYRRQTKIVDLDDDDDDDDDESPPLPHLIVVPVSTLPNWIREFEKFCPEMNVIKYHGSQQEREALKEDLREHLPKYQNKHIVKRTKLDVIVAPVSYFSRENSPDRKFLSNFKYDYLVVDEAHNLKNNKSTRYKMLDKVKTEHRLLLTGTPVQNNPQELLNMLSFIMPLFSKAGSSFEDEENYTEQMLKHFVDETADHGDEQTAYKKLKQLFAPFVLRRRKADVIAQLLPEKKRETVFVEMTKSTRSTYKSIIHAHFNKNGNTINPGTGEHLFTNLRKCAHHPLLLRTRWNTPEEKERLTENFYKFRAFKGDGVTKERVAEELESWNDFEIHLMALDLIEERKLLREFLGRYVLPEKDLFSSSKFESLRTLLPSLINDGHRVLVFSSWTSCLDLLGCLLQHLGIKFQRMDGSCPSDDRQRLIDQFNTDFSYNVFLLSTKACGLGINLTSADTCIIHDLDFNPFNDLQAEDRCHRIGQKKPVTVYKLITKDSVDEDIFKMQERKAKMNAAIMDSSSSRKEKSEILKSVLQKAEKEERSSDSSVDEIVI